MDIAGTPEGNLGEVDNARGPMGPKVVNVNWVALFAGVVRTPEDSTLDIMVNDKEAREMEEGDISDHQRYWSLPRRNRWPELRKGRRLPRPRGSQSYP